MELSEMCDEGCFYAIASGMEHHQCHGKCSVLEAECTDDDDALAHVMVQSLCRELAVTSPSPAPCKCPDITHCDGSCANRRYVERERSESGALIDELLECLKDARRLLTDQDAIDLAHIDEVIAKAEGTVSRAATAEEVTP